MLVELILLSRKWTGALKIDFIANYNLIGAIFSTLLSSWSMNGINKLEIIFSPSIHIFLIEGPNTLQKIHKI